MKNLIIIISLLTILGLSIALALYTWIGLGNVEISTIGLISMATGIGLSLIVGIGLMMLVYHSAKSGHDETIDTVSGNHKRQG